MHTRKESNSRPARFRFKGGSGFQAHRRRGATWIPVLAAAVLSCSDSSDSRGTDSTSANVPEMPGSDASTTPGSFDTGSGTTTGDVTSEVTSRPASTAGTGTNEAWPPPREGCNGHEVLCDRPFPEVVFPGTHNSMSNDEDGWIVPNQNRNIRAQLIDGIRVFLLDTYEERGELLLCHGFCVLGKRSLIEALEEFRSFLEANPREVVTFIFEDHIPGERTVEAIETAGLLPFVHTQAQGETWLTLGEMIEGGRRLVVTAERAGPPPDWLHHVWEVGWDTPFSFSSVEEFSCRANRGSPENDLFLVNHWVLDPVAMAENAILSNAYDTLMERIDACIDEWDRLPTFIAVDFHDVGDLFEVVDVLNGVRDARP